MIHEGTLRAKGIRKAKLFTVDFSTVLPKVAEAPNRLRNLARALRFCAPERCQLHLKYRPSV
jgi:hypothetical protein